MCTCVYISVTNWCIVGYLSDVLWDLWVGSIGQMVGMNYQFSFWKNPNVPLLCNVPMTGQSVGGIPVDDFCKLVCLMDMRCKQNLLVALESESCPAKIMDIFQYDMLSIKAVNLIYLTGVSNPPLLRHYTWLLWEADCYGLTLRLTSLYVPQIIKQGADPCIVTHHVFYQPLW